MKAGGELSKYGRQPVADVVLHSKYTRVQIAEAMGITITKLNNVLAGAQIPPQDIIDGLCEILEKEPKDLFSPEPLARKIGKRYKYSARVSEGDIGKVEQPLKRKGVSMAE